MLNSADAFELPPIPGLGYLAVDGDKARFKAALCGLGRQFQDSAGPDVLAAGPARPLNSLLRPLSLSGPEPTDGRTRAAQPRTNDLQVLVTMAGDAGAGRARQVWVEPLPAELTLGTLRDPATGLPDDDGPATRGVAVGLADLPERQRQLAVRYDPGGPAATWAWPGLPGPANPRSCRPWC